jgi:hypothetical protein
MHKFLVTSSTCNIGGKLCEIDAFRISAASSLRRIISPIKSDLFTLIP